MTKKEAKQLRPGNVWHEENLYFVVDRLDPADEPRFVVAGILLFKSHSQDSDYPLRGHIFDLGYDTATWEMSKRIA